MTAPVTPEEIDAMKRLRDIMEGKTPEPSYSQSYVSNPVASGVVELPGAGVVTESEINAMSDVMRRFNTAADTVTEQRVYESDSNPEVRMALQTRVNAEGVKIGAYQIQIKEDLTRTAGKQFYGIYHTRSNDIIADDITLYETAFNVVKLLNKGHYVNNYQVRRLFELDDAYTAHRIDAINFKRKIRQAEKAQRPDRAELYESRCQASIDRAMQHKHDLKAFIKQLP